MSITRFTPRPGLTIYTGDNHPLVLEREIGKGGEGSVWSIRGTSSSQVVAKFYHEGLSPDKAKKIEAMCRLKSDSLLRVSAWPTDILRPSISSAPQGILMPEIVGFQEVHLLYTPKSRRIHFPDAQLPFIVHTSINIARAFATVHDAGQVIGDVNHANLMVAKDATVRLIDCDGFEITDGESSFPCFVGVPTYTPPELQGQSFSGIRRTAQHDVFGLAVLLFHMLFLGRHPFSGIFRQGKGDKTIEEAIHEFRFAYLPDARRTEMEQPPWVPRLSAYPADIGGLFARAFDRGGANGKRPTACEWIPALEGLSKSLKRCAANVSHYYYTGLASCPWCVAENACGIPMFGITITVTRTPNFDLIAIWADIEAIRPDLSAAPQFANAYIDQCKPDAGITEVKWDRRKKRMMAAGAILLAIAVVAPGTIPPLFSIAILIGGLLAGKALWRLGTISAESFAKGREEALRSFNTACARWQAVEQPPAAFSQAKYLLQAQRHEFENLASLKTTRMNELRSQLRSNQLRRYLERHRILDATIPGIGAGRKSLLIACGIVDASDVTPWMNIKGFGPALKSNLLGWRHWVEQGFVFNPNEPIDPADLRVLEQQMAQKHAALVAALSNGPATLKKVLHEWQVERSSAIANVNFWSKALAQAEVDRKALGRI